MTKPTQRTVTPRTTAAAVSPLHTITSFMGGLIASIAAGTSSWTGKFVASLHETRRQQARHTLERYQHLVHECMPGFFSTASDRDSKRR